MQGEETISREAADSAKKFAIWMAVICAFLSIFPNIIAISSTGAGGRYVGSQINVDDHMVYAAWMHQAAEGKVLFSNRFTTDPQPSLTFHSYFLILGWLSAVIGIVGAMMLGKAVFTFLTVWTLYRLLRRIAHDAYVIKAGMTLAILGGGIGFLVWANFGVALSPDSPALIQGALLGKLPIDVWQPEAFVFPSLLTNGLFMASLWLILEVLRAILEAKESSKSVLRGAIAMLVLMNIHSYDALLIVLTMVAYVIIMAAKRQLDLSWLARGAAILCGAIPSALWFAYVYKTDEVFQARAATPTYAPNFRIVFAGLVLLIAVAAFGCLARCWHISRPRVLGASVLGLVGFATLWIASANHDIGYFLGWPAWIAAYLAVIALMIVLPPKGPDITLWTTWALLTPVVIYFPALFQRKLAMGMAMPWGVVAAVGLAAMLAKRARTERNLATTLVIVVLVATSLKWMVREFELIKNNVSTTTMHPVWVQADAARILDYLNQQPVAERRVLAMPGMANPSQVPGEFRSPYLPDLNPIATGLAGCVTYAGHWSETPDYGHKRSEVTRFFLSGTPDSMRLDLITKADVRFLIAPIPEAFPEVAQLYRGLGIADLSRMGEVVVNGNQFQLIRLSR